MDDELRGSHYQFAQKLYLVQYYICYMLIFVFRQVFVSSATRRGSPVIVAFSEEQLVGFSILNGPFTGCISDGPCQCTVCLSRDPAGAAETGHRPAPRDAGWSLAPARGLCNLFSHGEKKQRL